MKPRPDREAGARRAPRSWVAHAALVAVVLAVVGYLNIGWHRLAEDNATTVTRIATLRGLLANERDLQWRAFSAGEPTLEVAERLGQTRKKEDLLLEALHGTGVVEQARLQQAVDEYHAALDRELALITLDRTDEAVLAESTRTTPAYRGLDQLLQAAADRAAAASRGDHNAADGMLALALAAVALLFAGVLHRDAAAHREAQRAAAALLAQERAVKEALEREGRLVRHQATHDPLTGLANRLAFTGAVEELQRRDEPVAVVFVDLDGFKAVNDRFGHATGDEVLCTVARRLRATVRQDELAARLGGDEFAVLARVADPQAGAALAARVADALERPPVVVGALPVGASVGHVVGPGRDLPELLRRADARMYAVKAQHRARTGAAAVPPRWATH